METDWPEVPFNELGEVNRGRSRYRPRYAEHLYGGSYPFIQTGDVRASGGRITQHSQTYSEAGLEQSRLWPAGTMCITIAANIAETGILSYPACFPDSVVGFIADQNVCDVRFIEYNFRLLKRRLQSEAIGSVQDNINLATLARLNIPLPPLPEQKAIAHILGTLDDKIELNRRMNATLEGMAQALFKSWFVDFDPVIDNALAAGNPIPDELAARAEVRRQALANGTANRDAAKLFPAAFQETESMDWIPEGWEHNTIGKLIEVTDYVANGSFASLKANVTLSDDPDYALYVRTTDFKHGFSLSKAKYTTKSSYDFLEKSRLFGDEIIISNVGDTGTVFRPPVWRGEPMTLGSNAIAVKTAKDCHYFYEYFRSDFGQHQISGIVGGSAQPKFNKTDFRSLHLHLPPQQIRKAYCESVECIWERHISVLRNNEALTKLRDTLLPKLISGKLRILGAGKQVENAK